MQPNKNRNIVWIASYPKSGNTWVRSILYCATHGKVELNRMGDMIPSFTACVERVANDRGLSDIDDAAELWGDTQQWISSLGGFRVIKTHNVCGRIGGIRFQNVDHLICRNVISTVQEGKYKFEDPITPGRMTSCNPKARLLGRRIFRLQERGYGFGGDGGVLKLVENYERRFSYGPPIVALKRMTK